MAMTREFYIELYVPKGATKIAMKDGGAVFYTYKTKFDEPAAICFVGRAQKPTWRYKFSDEARREQKISQQIKAVQERAKRNAARHAEQNKPHNWEKGMILTGSWGYDQTNVDFFEVTKVIGKTMVEIVAIGSQSATDAPSGFSSMSDHVVPNPDARGKNKYRVKVSRNSIKSPNYGTASPWDGRPVYCSWYA